jgi:hypothetical protein
MELTINVKEETKLAFFIKLLQEFNYVEIIDMKENQNIIPNEHKVLLKKRLEKIECGESSFKSWDLIKTKYQKNAI